MTDDRVAKAVAAGKINSRAEDSARKMAGLALGAITVGAMGFSSDVRHTYGTCCSALGTAISLYRSGKQSL